MNRDPEQHLKRAKAYLAIAESRDTKREAYKQAAKEIVAYKKETGANNVAIAIALGRTLQDSDSKARDAGRNYVQKLIQWHTSGFQAETPFLMDKQATSRAAASHTKATLRDAPLEQVESIIESLPPARRQAIAAAAGNSYARARQEHEEAEAQLTPAERREREQAQRRLTQPGRQATGAFSALGIVGHIEQATDELRELTEDASLTPKAIRSIERAVDDLVDALKFASQLVGGRADS